MDKKTESAAMPLRICEAPSAVEQSRLSDIETDSEEDSALKNAVRGIATKNGSLREEPTLLCNQVCPHEESTSYTERHEPIPIATSATPTCAWPRDASGW